MKVVLFEVKNTFLGSNQWNKHVIGILFIYGLFNDALNV
jgi:hypothetical protein